MIPRRHDEHLKTHNWLAVATDFVISQRWTNDLDDVVASEMSRQGLPRSTELRKQIRSYYRADNGSERDFSDVGLYRERVRRIIRLAAFEDQARQGKALLAAIDEELKRRK